MMKKRPGPQTVGVDMSAINQILTAYIMNNLRILKAKNPGDLYYDEYLKHFERDRNNFYDQYHLAVMRVVVFKPTRILEIGVRTGLSICNMLSAYTDIKDVKRVVLCDIWSDPWTSPEIVKMNLRALNLNIEPEFIKGDSRLEIPKLDGEFDYILVDGDHDKKTSRQDLENVVRLCAKGGVIVFDDISPYGCGLMDVWENFKATHKDEFIFNENINGKGTAWGERK